MSNIKLIVKSSMSLDCKLLIYKSIIKPVWTYGIQLWAVAAKSNIDRFQNKLLRIITNAAWYINNDRNHSNLNISLVIDEVRRYSYNYMQRLANHSRALVLSEGTIRRLICCLDRAPFGKLLHFVQSVHSIFIQNLNLKIATS